MNQFYIYTYLDPRKSGQYCYNDICFLLEPIYIGKCLLLEKENIQENTIQCLESTDPNHGKKNTQIE